MAHAKTSEAAIEWVARLGYAARGVVYLIVGGLALLAALGYRGKAVGTRGALQELLLQPFGRGLLWAVAAGLLCFACWRAMQAAFDADRHGSKMPGLLRRAGFAGGALVHLGLAALAVSIIFQSRQIADDDQVARDWTAWLLGKPFGAGLVFLAGVGFAVVGIAFAVKAMRAEFRARLAVGTDSRGFIVALGCFGFAARGAVFVLIGAFLGVAALHFNSGEAAGLAGALRALQQQPYGWILLGVTALGLLAFGAFEVMQAFVRQVDAPRVRRTAAQAAGPKG